jgi:hypothetical protein
MVRLSDSFLDENKNYSLDLRQLAAVHLSGDDFETGDGETSTTDKVIK